MNQVFLRMPAAAGANALIEAHQVEDGWLWGITFGTSNFNHAHPPSKSSNRLATTRSEAITAAIQSMQTLISSNTEWMLKDPAFTKDAAALQRIRTWLATIHNPAVIPLF